RENSRVPHRCVSNAARAIIPQGGPQGHGEREELMIKARWFVCGLVAAGLAVAIGAAPASAGPPGRWTQVTAEAQSSNTGTVGVERTADGTLHVLWARDSGPTEELVHTSIAPDA